MNRTWAVAGLLAALLLPTLAPAAGTATIEAGPEGKRKRAMLEYRGDQLRLETQVRDGLPVVLLQRDGSLYILANDLVLDAEQAMALLGQQVPIPTVGPLDFSRFIALEPTPRTELHAGIGGKVYLLRYADRAGEARAEEMVMSTDPRAVELSRALLAVGDTLRRSTEVPAVPDEARLRAALQGQGVLRFGRDFRVLALSAQSPPPARFELPSMPLRFPSFEGFGR
ncbi:MAG TPA: hypothetical protein VGE57_01855 [Solimonas sp.]